MPYGHIFGGSPVGTWMFPRLRLGKLVGTWIWLSVSLLPAQDIVEGGSPLYQTAVHEALEGLRGRDKAASPVATPAPCATCGKVHAAPAQGTNAVAAAVAPAPAPIAAAGTPCAVCGQVHAAPQPRVTPRLGLDLAAGVPPAENTQSSDDLYYCERCKTHHRRKAAVPQ